MIHIIISIISLILYAFAVYISTPLIIKYVKRYEDISKIKRHVLVIYTVGFVSGLQAFLPSVFLVNFNPLLAFYMNYYNVILDFTVTFGIMILLSGTSRIESKRKFDVNQLIVLFISFILLIVLFLYGKINYVGGIILIISFFILSSYLYITGRKKNALSEIIEVIEKEISLTDAIIYSIIIALAISVIYIGGITLNLVSKVLESYGLSSNTIGYIFALILFTLPNIFYEIIAYRKTKNIRISTSDIFGEELSEFTLFIGLLSLFNTIIFPKSQYIPLLASVFGFYTSSLIIYMSAYVTDIPRGVGIFLITLGAVIGFLNINVIV